MASFSDSEGENYEVKEILDVRKKGRNTEYLVKWKDFESDEETWEPAKNMRHADKVIQAFEEKRLAVTPPRRRNTKKEVQKEEQTTRTGRGVTRKTTTVTKVETRTIGGTQSESSSPESSPLLGRRQLKTTEYRQVTSSTNQSPSRRIQGQGILELTQLDLPILVLLTCILFVILTFVVSQK